jgi:hypothetical protein
VVGTPGSPSCKQRTRSLSIKAMSVNASRSRESQKTGMNSAKKVEHDRIARAIDRFRI